MSMPPAEPLPPTVELGAGDGRRRRRRRGPVLLIVVGLVLLLGVGGWQLYVTLWTTHSERAGHALVHRFLKNRALTAPVNGSAGHRIRSTSASTATLAACTTAGSGATQPSTPVHGLLEIPKLAVVAPVEQGVGDAQLAEAVGHDPYSVWPGSTGNAVLEAHDVSYFSAIAELKPGDVIRYVAPCTTYVFRVTSHAIVTQGSPVYNTSTPTITLVTCWPTDALWFTPDRYLVTATEISKSATGGSGQQYLTVSNPPSVPIPPQLSSQGVTLATYSLPMGTFTLTGHPDVAWGQTTSPLLADGSGVEAFIAGVRALTENRLDWWRQLAPGVSPPTPLLGAPNPGYVTPTDVTETATGTNVTAVTMTDTVAVSGGKDPGRYTMTVQEKVHDHTLTIASWTMTPA